jgi:hypothetical protein
MCLLSNEHPSHAAFASAQHRAVIVAACFGRQPLPANCHCLAVVADNHLRDRCTDQAKPGELNGLPTEHELNTRTPEVSWRSVYIISLCRLSGVTTGLQDDAIRKSLTDVFISQRLNLILVYLA